MLQTKPVSATAPGPNRAVKIVVTPIALVRILITELAMIPGLRTVVVCHALNTGALAFGTKLRAARRTIDALPVDTENAAAE
jgi:hypothetical protein